MVLPVQSWRWHMVPRQYRANATRKGIVRFKPHTSLLEGPLPGLLRQLRVAESSVRERMS